MKNVPHPQAAAQTTAKPTASRKRAAGKVSGTKTVSFAFVRDTKPGEKRGAYLYGEVDAKGQVIDTGNKLLGGLDAALIGGLYIRKQKLGADQPPATITLALSY